MRRAYVDIPEGQMHYRFAGEGQENVILLHMSGSSSEEYEGAGDILAQRGYHVYAIDLLGFGSSDKPAHYYYSMDEHITSILAFMDSLEIHSAYFYGNLATANMAAKLAVRCPERVKGLMLAHPLYNPDPDFFKRRGHTLAFCKVDVTEDGSYLQELWKRSNKYGDPIEVSDRRCADLHKAGEWGETLHWALHDDFPFGTYLPQLRVKTIIICYSRMGDPAALRSAAEQLADGMFDIYEDGAPYIARTAPQRVAGMLCKHFPINQ